MYSNEIAKSVANFGNFKQTLETIGQKFGEMHCKRKCHKFFDLGLNFEINQ